MSARAHTLTAENAPRVIAGRLRKKGAS